MGDTKLVQNEHDREEDDFGEDMEVDWLIYTSSDDDDNELVVWHVELEFVELDVGEGVMPTMEFTEELMDSGNDLEESEDDSSDDYYVEVAPPLEDEQDEL